MNDFKKVDWEKPFEDNYKNLMNNVKGNVDFLIDRYKDNLMDCMKDCESPIEQILSLYLNDGLFEYYYNNDIELLGIGNQEYIICDDKKYRVDFLIELAFKEYGRYKDVLKLVIECDGHEFHEKTKEQVQKDNERTRKIQSSGYEILRFSGSEIHNNPRKCVLEIKKYIRSKYRENIDK